MNLFRSFFIEKAIVYYTYLGLLFLFGFQATIFHYLNFKELELVFAGLTGVLIGIMLISMFIFEHLGMVKKLDTNYFKNVIAGIVSNFYTGETYYAELNKTPTLDNFPIQPAPYIEYKHGLIGMDISKDPKLEKTSKLIDKSRHTRQEGCSAASLCHVADGTLDAHIDLRGIVRATDISAGLLIIKEAGGVYSINGELFGDIRLTRETKCTVIAANSKQLHKEIMELLV